jgi:hypothetical protein
MMTGVYLFLVVVKARRLHQSIDGTKSDVRAGLYNSTYVYYSFIIRLLLLTKASPEFRGRVASPRVASTADAKFLQLTNVNDLDS